MARFAWLTPDTPPATNTCRVLIFPDDVAYLAIIAGALIELTYPDNFEQFGTATPAQTAAVFDEMFNKFSANEGVCRVIGEIICYGGPTSPDPKWLLCDGASIPRADYPDLFAVIGTTYGAVDGSHFSVPDLRGRVGLAMGTGSGLSTYSLGNTGGEETHTLTTPETPAHSHTDTGHSHSEGAAAPSVGAAITGVPVPSAIPTASVTGLGSASLTSAGGGGAHENRQPYIALNYLIVALQ